MIEKEDRSRKRKTVTLFAKVLPLLAATSLTACSVSSDSFRADRVAWSPDGSRALLVTADGLKVTDLKGALADVPSEANPPVNWMPDGQSFFAVTSEKVTTWDELKGLISDEEEDVKRVIAAAKLCSKLASAGKTLGTLTSPDDDSWNKATADLNTDHVYLYLKSTEPEALKKWSGAAQPVESQVSVDVVRSYQVVPQPSKTGPILLRDPFVIQEIETSPRGDTVAIVIGFGEHNRVILISKKQPTLKPVTVAVDATNLEWFDNENVVFIKRRENSSGSAGELSIATVLDSEGNLQKNITTRRLAKAGYDDSSFVQCTSDGIFFYGPAKVTNATEGIEHKLVKVMPYATPVVVPILPNHFNAPGSSPHFKISPDGKHIAVLQQNGTVDVLDTDGGAATKVQDVIFSEDQYNKSCFTPQWRNSDEVCFSAPTTNGPRAAAVMLWSLTRKTRTELSSNWPAKAVPFLEKAL